MTRKLADCIEIMDFRRRPLSSKMRENLNKIYPYYGAQGIIDYVDEYLFDGEYILVAEDGNNLKSLSESIVTWATGQFWVNNHAHILGKKEGVNLRYVYYYLKAIDIRCYITGSAQPKLTQENLAKVEIELPSIEVQNQVVNILQTLDSLIANNNTYSSTLEETAKALYDYWFTQFDFPNEEGKPYRSSGGKMVWNEELKREIPEGWKVGKLRDVMNIIANTVTPWNSPRLLWEHYSIPAYDKNCYPAFEEGATIESNKYVVPDESILVSKLNPQFKRLWRPLYITGNSICSTEFIPLVPKEKNQYEFCYELLNSDSFHKYLSQSASSSTGSRTRIQPDILIDFPTVLVPNNLVESYSKIISPILKQCNTNTIEKIALTSLRDYLLPLLMNGQVTIED